MSDIEEWLIREQKQKEIRNHQIAVLRSRLDKMQEISENMDSKDYPENPNNFFTKGNLMTLEEYLSTKPPKIQDIYMQNLDEMRSQSSQKSIIKTNCESKITPINQNDYFESLEKIKSQSAPERSSIIRRIKCFFGIHNWGRWTYCDYQNRTKLKRECLECHRQQYRTAVRNDLAD